MTSKATNPKEFGDFLSRYSAQQTQNLRQLTTFKDQLLQLDKDYRDVCQELAKERAAKQSVQDKSKHLIKTLEGAVAAHDKTVRDSSFVLVLVDADGDGYLMHNYLQQQQDAVEGGTKAAKELRVAVGEHLQMAYGEQEAGLPVVTKAFASGHGRINVLEKTTGMRRYDAQKSFMGFMSGFSQAEELFDFVVVDRGKERADRKLEASFRQFVKNPCCQHILLACCHDNGYVRMLEKYVGDPVARNKIVLVKSTQTGAEFASLPFLSTTLGGFFIQHPPPSPKLPTPAPTPNQARPGFVVPAVVTASSAAAATLSIPNKASDTAAATSASTSSSPLAGHGPDSHLETKEKTTWWLSKLLSFSKVSEKPGVSPEVPKPFSAPSLFTVPASVPTSVSLEPSTPPQPSVCAAEARPLGPSLGPPSFLPSTPPSQRAKPRTPSPASSSSSPPHSGLAAAKAVPKSGTFGSGDRLSERTILVNAQNQRIDAPLPGIPETVRESMRKRQKYKQFCYQHQLQANCFRSNCQFSHEKLSADELSFLRRQSRTRKCVKESRCRDVWCIYGHSCSCSQKECLLGSALHNLNTSTWTCVESGA